MLMVSVPPKPATRAPAIVTGTRVHDTKMMAPSESRPSATQIIRARPNRLISRGAITAVSIAPTARPVPCRPEIGPAGVLVVAQQRHRRRERVQEVPVGRQLEVGHPGQAITDQPPGRRGTGVRVRGESGVECVDCQESFDTM